MSGTKDFDGYAAQGETAAYLIKIVRSVNLMSATGKLTPSGLSVVTARNSMRNATGNNSLTFQTCTLAEFKSAFWRLESDDAVVQEALDTMSVFEQIIELAQSLSAGLPSENS